MNDSKFIQIQGVEQAFKTPKGRFVALQGIDLTVAKGEFVALIGHSGCGKSTLLNLIAGLTRPTQGALLCANREIAGPGPERAVVFQNHSLLPWLTCFENVYLAVGTAWLVIVAAEMLTGGVGIGFWVWDEWNSLNVKNIIIAIFVIGIVGLVLEYALIKLASAFTFEEVKA